METENRLIAEFLGWENENFNTTLFYYTLDGCLDENSLKFHSDWNWLMEVVEKIFKDFYNLNPCPIGLKIEIEKQLIKVNKEAVYNACLDFIKWYNEQK